LLVNVAVPSGTIGLDDQLAPSLHSLGSPPLPPIQVPSTAWAAVVTSAVLASRAAVTATRARPGSHRLPVERRQANEALEPNLIAPEAIHHPQLHCIGEIKVRNGDGQLEPPRTRGKGEAFSANVADWTQFCLAPELASCFLVGSRR